MPFLDWVNLERVNNNHKSPAMAMRYSHLNTDNLRTRMTSAWGAAT
jgi:hypothetical protein